MAALYEGAALVRSLRYAAAEPMYRRALAGYEKALGPEHPDTLMSVNNLGILLNLVGHPQAALTLLRQFSEESAKCKQGVRYNLAWC